MNKGIAPLIAILAVTSVITVTGVSYYVYSNSVELFSLNESQVDQLKNQNFVLEDAPLPNYSSGCGSYLTADVLDKAMIIGYPRASIDFSSLKSVTESVGVPASYIYEEGDCWAHYDDINSYDYSDPRGRNYDVKFSALFGYNMYKRVYGIWYSFLKSAPGFLKPLLGPFKTYIGTIDFDVNYRYNKDINNGAKDVQGVGDKAWWYTTCNSIDTEPCADPNAYSMRNSVALQFVKDHLLYSVHVEGVFNKRDGHSISLEGELAEATIIAKAIIPKLPSFNSDRGICADSASKSSSACNLPPSNLTSTFITQNSGTDIAGTVKLNWLNNGDYSGIEVERAKEKNYTDWTKIATLSGSDTTYSDDLGTIQLPEDKEGYRIRAVYPDGTHSPYSNVAELNNCVSMSANPAVNTIVFRREDNVKIETKYIFRQVKGIVEDYFSRVDPFKSYFSNFAFMFDLKQLQHKDLKYSTNTVSSDSAQAVRQTSSCRNNTMRVVISVVDNAGLYLAWADVQNGNIYMNVNQSFTQFNTFKKTDLFIPYFAGTVDGYTVLHELGHAIGHLNDEYEKSWFEYSDIKNLTPLENCAKDPEKDFLSSIDSHVYGSPKLSSNIGCGVSNTSSIGLYSPAPESMMNDQFAENSQKFNVISCGYLVAGILLEPTDKAHAEKYWPACMKMDTVKDGIPQATLDAYK